MASSDPEGSRSLTLIEILEIEHLKYGVTEFDMPAARYWNRISGVEHARDYDAYPWRKRNVFSLDLNVPNDKLFFDVDWTSVPQFWSSYRKIKINYTHIL